MIAACLEFLLGCAHPNQTRPFTLNHTCYTVCLDCGRELPYSWAEMRTLGRGESAQRRAAAWPSAKRRIARMEDEVGSEAPVHGRSVADVRPGRAA